MFIESFYTFLGEVVVFLAILVIILFIAILILGFLILILDIKSIPTIKSINPYTKAKYLPKSFLNIYINGNTKAADVTGKPV